MNIWDHISTDPQICHGKPCIKGTRVMVSVILGTLAGGTSFDEILEEYPPITDPMTTKIPTMNNIQILKFSVRSPNPDGGKGTTSQKAIV